MKLYAVRLKSGEDLKESLQAFVHKNKIQAGFIVTCVGSLNPVRIRMGGARPDQEDIRTYESVFEIVSLVGTVSASGSHLHISVADSEGLVSGGHLKEGCVVKTTAEIVLGEDENRIFHRNIDPETGFLELVVQDR